MVTGMTFRVVQSRLGGKAVFCQMREKEVQKSRGQSPCEETERSSLGVDILRVEGR